MDLGIAGRKAIVCASSRGLGRACAMRLAEAGCEVVVNGRDPSAARRDRRRHPQGDRRQGDRRRRRCRDAGRPGRAVRRLPRAGHPDRQQCRPAVPRFPRARPPEDDRRRDRQHDRAGRADAAGDRSDDQEQVRPHRQHHLGLGEDAARRARPVVRRARGPDRVPRRRRALGRRSTTSPSISCCRARSTPTGCAPTTRSPRRSRASRVEEVAEAPHGRRSRPGASATPTSSAPPARSCARRTPATSPGRTS